MDEKDFSGKQKEKEHVIQRRDDIEPHPTDGRTGDTRQTGRQTDR